MDATILLPSSDYELEHVSLDAAGHLLTLVIRSHQRASACPYCQQSSVRIHSHYERHLQDVACSEHAVELVLKVRRFFCDNGNCPRKTLSERIPGLVVPYGRQTTRLVRVMQQLGLLLGGEGSVKVLYHLGVTTTRWTVLREVCQLKFPCLPTPRVLGIDD